MMLMLYKETATTKYVFKNISSTGKQQKQEKRYRGLVGPYRAPVGPLQGPYRAPMVVLLKSAVFKHAYPPAPYAHGPGKILNHAVLEHFAYQPPPYGSVPFVCYTKI